MNQKFFVKSLSLLLALTLMAFSLPARASEAIPRARYLAYARASADWAYGHSADILAQWKKTFDPLNVFGYRPPGGFLETAVIYSYLYEKEKKPEYAERAKAILLSYGDYRSAYPESSAKSRPDYAEGVPALPDFFTVMRYIRAYDTLRRLGRFLPQEKTKWRVSSPRACATSCAPRNGGL